MLLLYTYVPAAWKYVFREAPDKPKPTCLALAPYLAASHPSELQPPSTVLILHMYLCILNCIKKII